MAFERFIIDRLQGLEGTVQRRIIACPACSELGLAASASATRAGHALHAHKHTTCRLWSPQELAARLG
jgi:hypothetical protein